MALFGKKEFSFTKWDECTVVVVNPFDGGEGFDWLFLEIVDLHDAQKSCSVFDVPNLQEFLKSIEKGNTSKLRLRIGSYRTHPNDSSWLVISDLDLYESKADGGLSYIGTIPMHQIGVNIFIKNEATVISSNMVADVSTSTVGKLEVFPYEKGLVAVEGLNYLVPLSKWKQYL